MQAAFFGSLLEAPGTPHGRFTASTSRLQRQPQGSGMRPERADECPQRAHTGNRCAGDDKPHRSNRENPQRE